jgi:hypothetical protein
MVGQFCSGGMLPHNFECFSAQATSTVTPILVFFLFEVADPHVNKGGSSFLIRTFTT